jgi:nitrate reductase alpha subunit
MDPASAAHWGASQTNLPSSAGWFTLSFTVPSGFSVHAIGLQLKSASAGGWIALDGLNWPG